MAIELHTVGVDIGRRAILSCISMTAPAGAVTAIVGPNGSGKTTLLRALCGDLPYRGRIRLNGRSLAAMKPGEAAALRAVLPQSTSLSFPYTVREIVALGLLNGHSGLDPKAAANLPERALARVDLDGFAGRFYQELSGGEQQRVQLARVLCQVWQPVLNGEPRFLLLDEPVSSLDIKHQLTVMRIAADFAAAGGGVIAVLHDLNLAARFADRVAIMKRGRLAACGAPSQTLSEALVSNVFDCRIRVGALPADGMPFVLPQTAEL